MKRDLLIGVDIGSSNVKAVLFDNKCRVLASELREYRTIVPRPGWTEYDPNEWWECVKITISSAIRKSNIDPSRIAGIGVSSLGASPVFMDAEGNAVHNAIPWSDQRTFEEANYLQSKLRDEIVASCRNIPSVVNSIPKLMWMKKHKPDVYANTFKFSEPSGFLSAKTYRRVYYRLLFCFHTRIWL